MLQINDLTELSNKSNIYLSLEHITSLKTTNLEQQKGMAEANWQDQIDKLTDERDSNKNQITVLLKVKVLKSYKVALNHLLKFV